VGTKRNFTRKNAEKGHRFVAPLCAYHRRRMRRGERTTGEKKITRLLVIQPQPFAALKEAPAVTYDTRAYLGAEKSEIFREIDVGFGDQSRALHLSLLFLIGGNERVRNKLTRGMLRERTYGNRKVSKNAIPVVCLARDCILI